MPRISWACRSMKSRRAEIRTQIFLGREPRKGSRRSRNTVSSRLRRVRVRGPEARSSRQVALTRVSRSLYNLFPLGRACWAIHGGSHMTDLRWLPPWIALTLSALAPEAFAATPKGLIYDHVLLISVDGLHAVDLSNYITANPNSTLATLAKNGVRYPNALTTGPSDSFPGLLAPTTGGTSRSTGVFYDDSYDRQLFPPGSNCSSLPGTEVVYAENLDKSLADATGGGTLGDPLSQIDPTQLPLTLAGGKCVPVYPHQFIKVNTIFEVIRAHGGHTAWADKHPAYEILNGPSGAGVDDLYTPEVNSNDPITGQDTTTGFCSIQRNDVLKVQAVLNEIAGLDSTGKHSVGVPTIFGMNFQAVSVGQKLARANAADQFVNTPGSLPPLYPVALLVLPPPNGLNCNDTVNLIGGYANASGSQLHTGLKYGLDFVDTELGFMLAALKSAGLAQGTLVIIEAKHGQSPINHALRQAVSDHPYSLTPGVAQVTTDDVALIWLSPQFQQTDYKAAEAYLSSQAKTLGIDTLLNKSALAPLYGNPFGNDRTPDFIAITTPGLIYTSGSKLAEHGGFTQDDRNVALLVSNPSIIAATVNDSVETRQIAATILDILGINPKELEGARTENTKALPGL